mmetsp:Transcript_92874/g.262270  ORF Transcript_92874/g.262270 Transcript_92874/m.262270 type:complete len:254 (-) Transcript_92874:1950-2711(-)
MTVVEKDARPDSTGMTMSLGFLAVKPSIHIPVAMAPCARNKAERASSALIAAKAFECKAAPTVSTSSFAGTSTEKFASTKPADKRLPTMTLSAWAKARDTVTSLGSSMSPNLAITSVTSRVESSLRKASWSETCIVSEPWTWAPWNVSSQPVSLLSSASPMLSRSQTGSMFLCGLSRSNSANVSSGAWKTISMFVPSFFAASASRRCFCHQPSLGLTVIVLRNSPNWLMASIRADSLEIVMSINPYWSLPPQL